MIDKNEKRPYYITKSTNNQLKTLQSEDLGKNYK